jgi:hypothetical protein
MEPTLGDGDAADDGSGGVRVVEDLADEVIVAEHLRCRRDVLHWLHLCAHHLCFSFRLVVFPLGGCGGAWWSAGYYFCTWRWPTLLTFPVTNNAVT